MEIELKYLIDKDEIIEQIFQDPYLSKIKDKNSDEEIEMHAVYFDTEDRRLYREGMAFRVRKEGNKLVATLKWNGTSEDGMHKREEINVPVDDEEKLKMPDIHIFDQSEMCQVLSHVVGKRNLIPLMDIYFKRRQMRLDTGKSISELSVDLGQIVCNGKVAPISEMEIELYSGEEEDMKALGDDVAEKYGLIAENTSTFKRGLDLM